VVSGSNGLSAVPEERAAESVPMDAAPPSGGFSARRLKKDRYYDLSEAGVDAKGYVPFPSHERRQRFFEDLDGVWEEIRTEAKERAKASEARDPEDEPGEASEGETGVEALLNRPKLFTDVFGDDGQWRERFVEIAARLCNGSPTRAQLKKLPPDVFMNGEDGFFDWLLSITVPKATRTSGIR
jgi:hypothetical protein